MNKFLKKSLVIGLSCLAAASLTMFAACSSDSDSSIRSQLESVDSESISIDLSEGTVSFTTVANARYYRFAFYYLDSPSDDYNNTSYFTTETVTVENPDGTTYESEDYATDEDGNYILIDDEEIINSTATYSKRYNAYYYDDDGEKTYYEAGETMTIELPNDSIPGGNYLFTIRSCGQVVLYTMSDPTVVKANLILKIPTPVVTTDYSVGYTPYGCTEGETNSFGSTSYSTDTDTIILDGTGMLLEIENADSLYSALSSMTLEYCILQGTYDDTSFDEYTFSSLKENSNAVSFDWENLFYYCSDSSSFYGWGINASGESETVGEANLYNYIYAHQGPTMYYTTTSFLYISGLTEGTAYTMFIYAEGDDGETCYDSTVGYFNFTFAYSDTTYTV